MYITHCFRCETLIHRHMHRNLHSRDKWSECGHHIVEDKHGDSLSASMHKTGLWSRLVKVHSDNRAGFAVRRTMDSDPLL